MAEPRRVVGIDAAGKHGWVGVVLEGGAFAEAAQSQGLEALIAAVEPVEIIAVDIPIGRMAGVRQADAAARAFVSPRGSSVFPAPSSDVWEMADCAAANAWLAERGRPQLSQQAWALVPKIREADATARADNRIFEVHPEVSFRAMATAGLPRKKSWEGALRRWGLLSRVGITLPAELGDAGSVAVDDILDAAAAAWSANRIATGSAATLPDPPEISLEQRQVAIWY